MPRSRNVADPEGVMDVEIEKPIAYISRLRKAAANGNVRLVSQIHNIERKIDQLVKVQQELEDTYSRRIKPIKLEFDSYIAKIRRDIGLAKQERDEIKNIVSTGFKKQHLGS